jgi:hypothetical protein
VRHGINDVSDWGVNAHLGLFADGLSAGLRGLYTRQLTADSQLFACSLVPAITYVKGSENSDDENNSIWSSSVGAELFVPMSYRLHRNVDFTWTPQVIYIHYMSTLHYGASGSYPSGESFTKNDLICPGLSVGFRFGFCSPQVNILWMTGEPTVTGGIALNLGAHK